MLKNVEVSCFSGIDFTSLLGHKDSIIVYLDKSISAKN
jgi:hypothetical protein